ncbi:MAG: hypothetical protein SH847_08365 [Roseiflexaceae bacterium]|nr:hypothetical protein [Roseiflexaceae bacterium]
MSLSLMRTQLATLFTLDQHGRMLCVNEPDDPPAPRLFIGRTTEGAIWAIRYDLPDDLAVSLSAICAAEPIATHFDTAPQYAPVLRSLLEVGAEEYRGPAYIFRSEIPHVTGAILITPEQRAVLAPHFPELIAEYAQRAPIAVMVEQGIAVTACWCSRQTEHAAEAGIMSIPDVRQRGYAVCVAAQWGRAVQAAGMTALYSTSWDNVASQGVARKLGLHLYGEDWQIT